MMPLAARATPLLRPDTHIRGEATGCGMATLTLTASPYKDGVDSGVATDVPKESTERSVASEGVDVAIDEASSSTIDAEGARDMGSGLALGVSMPRTSEADMGATADVLSGDDLSLAFLILVGKPYPAGSGALPPLVAWRAFGLVFL
jgi:hypothetical protein